MEQYLIIARSVTHAQRMERVLGRAGIRAQSFHAPLELTEGRGCAYAIRIDGSALQTALSALIRAGLRPVRVFSVHSGQFQEVRL